MKEIAIICVVTLLITQGITFVVDCLKEKKLIWSALYATGGFPSSHSSLVSSLFFSLFFYEGISNYTIIAGVFGLLVIRDAFGLRKEVGDIAKQVNKINKKLKLNERAGHTFFQVLGGVIIGFIISLVGFIIL